MNNGKMEELSFENSQYHLEVETTSVASMDRKTGTTIYIIIWFNTTDSFVRTIPSFTSFVNVSYFTRDSKVYDISTACYWYQSIGRIVEHVHRCLYFKRFL